MSTIIEIKKKAQRYLKFPVALAKNDIVFNEVVEVINKKEGDSTKVQIPMS
jgi:hypothetical protein